MIPTVIYLAMALLIGCNTYLDYRDSWRYAAQPFAISAEKAFYAGAFWLPFMAWAHIHDLRERLS